MSEMWTPEQQQERRMIEAACVGHGMDTADDEWILDEDNDGRPKVALGDWTVTDEDEDRGLYHGDRGTLSATCVGSESHRNIRVVFYFLSEDHDEGGEDVVPFEEVQPA